MTKRLIALTVACCCLPLLFIRGRRGVGGAPTSGLEGRLSVATLDVE